MSLVDEYLNPDAMKHQSIIEPETVNRTVSLFKGKKGSVAVDRLWLLLVFMMWRKRYL